MKALAYTSLLHSPLHIGFTHTAVENGSLKVGLVERHQSGVDQRRTIPADELKTAFRKLAYAEIFFCFALSVVSYAPFYPSCRVGVAF